MKKIVIGLIMVFILQGCISSPEKRYFQLYVEPGEAIHSEVRFPVTILVDPPQVAPVYNDYRVVYRLSPYELNYYSYRFWIKKPGYLVQDAMSGYFNKKKVFGKVIFKLSEGDAEYLLRSTINAIEEYDQKSSWYAHLNMTLEVQRIKTGETVLSYSFDRRKPLTSKSLDLLPAGLSNILEEELTLFLEQLETKFGK